MQKRGQLRTRTDTTILLKLGIPAALLLVLFLFLLLGGTGGIQAEQPAKGIQVISIPFAGDGKETIPLMWDVQGDTSRTGIYHSTSPNVLEQEQAGYLEGRERDDTFYAELPNPQAKQYVRIHAVIDGEDHWSEEYEIES